MLKRRKKHKIWSQMRVILIKLYEKLKVELNKLFGRVA